MNPTTAQARVLIDELARNGVSHIVISPGSWSTALALAAYHHGQITTHVRIDERSAAFCALGIARYSNTPAAVLCTSGTAAVNYHPAVAEADATHTSLIVLTADRPPELRDVGASQTISQNTLYGPMLRHHTEITVAERRIGSVKYWRSSVARSVAAATHPSNPGPVQINIPLRKPFLPDDSPPWPESLEGRECDSPWTRETHTQPLLPDSLALPTPPRGIVVLGDAPVDPAVCVHYAEQLGWPVLAEPTSLTPELARSENLITSGALLIESAQLRETLLPECVVTSGKITLSPSLLEWIAQIATHIHVDEHPLWPDPMRSVTQRVPALPNPPKNPPDPAWLTRWRAAHLQAVRALASSMSETMESTSELGVLRVVGQSASENTLVVLGSSLPIREAYLTMPFSSHPRTMTNRGVAGIDGVLSTAVGAAVAHQERGGAHTVVVLGDLSFLHDHNGALIPSEDTTPNLTVIVLNNNGGGIFSQLPQAGQDVRAFEYLFGTPHSVDFAHLAASTHTPYRLVDTVEELAALLAETPTGVRIIEVRSIRRETAEHLEAVRSAVNFALSTVLE